MPKGPNDPKRPADELRWKTSWTLANQANNVLMDDININNTPLAAALRHRPWPHGLGEQIYLQGKWWQPRVLGRLMAADCAGR